MASREPKIHKKAYGGITGHIKFTIPGTIEIIMKPGIATS
jgi:hypothetical protein